MALSGSGSQDPETATGPPGGRGSGTDLLPTWPLGLSLLHKSLRSGADRRSVASYVTGKDGGDSGRDDNLQWLRHGPHDENRSLAPVGGVKAISGGERG